MNHMLECDKMMEMVDMSDITRIMTRLLLKVEKWGQEQGETLPFSQGVRRFSDLLSHSDKIDDNDEEGRRIFGELMQIIPDIVGSWEYFKEMFGRFLINSVEVAGDDDEKVGWALYLGPSILDHSCLPSAAVSFRGKRMLVTSKVIIMR